MTRFARAQGSKASNERVPEQATSWKEMQQQLLDKNKQIEDEKNYLIANKKRQENYKAFLEETENSKETKWADFPDTGPPKKKARKSVSKSKNNNDSDNEQPEECSSKIPQPEVQLVQKKQKKKALKIKIDNNLKAPEEHNEENLTVNNTTGNNKVLKNGAEVKKNIKNKSKKGGKVEVKPKKSLDEMTEEERKKVERKKQKRLKQVLRKKLKKEQLKTDKSETVNEVGSENQSVVQQHNPENTQKVYVQNFTTFKTANNNKKLKSKNNEKPDKRRKPQADKMIINGVEVAISYIDGFPIKKEDAQRIHQLRKQMISKGLPRSEIKIALKLERRKAEKAFAREKKKVCFNCRKSGHNLSECTELGEKQLTESAGTGICFKCGSTEHTHFECKVVRGQEFKFAQCFICQEQGHIARQCPDNARGLYPKGGACKMCGDVTHLKKDCPKFQAQQQQLQDNVQAEIFDGRNPDSLDGNEKAVAVKNGPGGPKKIKFL